jgi:hypothetical protein
MITISMQQGCKLRCIRNSHKDDDYSEITKNIDACEFNKNTKLCHFNPTDIHKKITPEQISRDLHLELKEGGQ